MSDITQASGMALLFGTGGKVEDPSSKYIKELFVNPNTFRITLNKPWSANYVEYVDNPVDKEDEDFLINIE